MPIKSTGTNAEVYAGMARRTPGGKTKSQLIRLTNGTVRAKSAVKGGAVSMSVDHRMNVPHPIQMTSGGSLDLKIDALVGVGGGRLTKAQRVARRQNFKRKLKTAARKIGAFIKGDLFNRVASTAIDLAMQSGIPKLQVAAMTAQELFPWVQRAVEFVGRGSGGAMGSFPSGARLPIMVVGSGVRLP